jgi:folate-binding protein YgfZ
MDTNPANTPADTVAAIDLQVYRALHGGAAWRRLDDRIAVRVVGDDRVSFLQGMLSNDIRAMHPGDAAPTLLLTEHAHVIADLFVYTEADAFILETERALWPRARAHLERFLVADDVEFEELANWAMLDIEGPRAAEVAARIHREAEGLAPWRFVPAGNLRIANLPRYDWPAISALGESGAIAALEAALLERALEVPQAGAAAFEGLRIERGIARIGVDTNEKTLALEARLERAISLNKGCYIGQETLERATAHGSLKKKLYGLRLHGGSAPTVGAAVMLAGREVGVVTSAALSPGQGALGLGIIHHGAWTAGTVVVLKDSGGERAAAVSDLPFK